LFISTLTDSAVLIGLIPAFHIVGWQLPQLFTARRISRLPRYKPYVLLATIHERIPFFGLALIAWFSPHLNNNLALVISFLFLLWQGFGGGFAGNAWQNMIGKVFPAGYLATFFGIQSAAANLLASGGALVAGIMLERLDPPLNYALCFFLAGLFMALSFGFIALTREPARIISAQNINAPPLWNTIVTTIKSNRNFTGFLVARILSQFGLMAFAFYVVYAVRYHDMSEGMAGIMTSVLFFTQVISNPVLGQVADRWSRKHLLEIGAVAITISALLAWQAPDLSWFYLVFILAGVANTTFWSISMALTLDFGTEDERPTYVGMANTLIAPAGILAPLLGGWLADTAGFSFTFITAAAAGLVTAALLFFFVHEPKRITKFIEPELDAEN
jgi:MFS family permease